MRTPDSCGMRVAPRRKTLSQCQVFNKKEIPQQGVRVGRIHDTSLKEPEFSHKKIKELSSRKDWWWGRQRGGEDDTAFITHHWL